MTDRPKLIRKLRSGDIEGRQALEKEGYIFRRVSKTGAQIFVLTDAGSTEEATNAIKTTFGLECDLQQALRANLGQLEPGLKIVDGDKERVVESGRIDITAEDETGTAVVIELKAGTADREAIGQILSYMGDLQAQGKEKVRGILVAGNFTPRATAAAKAVPNVALQKYGFKFTFTVAGKSQ